MREESQSKLQDALRPRLVTLLFQDSTGRNITRLPLYLSRMGSGITRAVARSPHHMRLRDLLTTASTAGGHVSLDQLRDR
ncbi:hypothetical protein CSUI_002375 [Cystoisospora suis]|uniref:Uncharacterized protein n=1 Tax=Cystoisospora suis TaxID=483139 RepID=A0A2C6KIA7_9APIC|nr:hypothetical protein CSUI_002375 [Cystoisospora suis]